MVYLIYSNQIAAIKNRVKKIAKDILGTIDEMNYVRFDAENVLIQDCIEDASYLPLGYDKKVVVIDRCYFLNKTKTKNSLESDQKYDSLINFIKENNEECNVILTVPTFDISKTSDIYKAVEEFGTLVPIQDPDASTWKQGVERYCRATLKMSIDNDALIELAERTNGDVALLQNSAQKLSLYTDHVTFDDVIKMVAKPLEDNAFQIFNCLLNDNIGGALSVFRDLKTLNTEPVTLVAMLASQFRFLFQVLYLSRCGLDNDSIAVELGVKPARVSIARKNSLKISLDCIQKTLDDLFNLDLQIKSGQIDRFYIFELFLINFKRN